MTVRILPGGLDRDDPEFSINALRAHFGSGSTWKLTTAHKEHRCRACKGIIAKWDVYFDCRRMNRRLCFVCLQRVADEFVVLAPAGDETDPNAYVRWSNRWGMH